MSKSLDVAWTLSAAAAALCGAVVFVGAVAALMVPVVRALGVA